MHYDLSYLDEISHKDFNSDLESWIKNDIAPLWNFDRCIIIDKIPNYSINFINCRFLYERSLELKEVYPSFLLHMEAIFFPKKFKNRNLPKKYTLSEIVEIIED